MAAIKTVASRFAVLPDDDTTDWTAPKTKKSSSKQTAKQKDEQQQQQGKKKKGSSSSKKEEDDLRSMAFSGGGSGGGKSSSSAKKGSSSSTPAKGGGGKQQQGKKSPELSQEWKEKDEKFVNETYSAELHQALLQSKIDFEEQQKLVTAALSSSPPKTTTKKKSKPLTLSEFNNLNSEEGVNGQRKKKGVSSFDDDLDDEEEEDYFKTVEEDRDKVLGREERLDAVRRTPAPNNQFRGEPPSSPSDGGPNSIGGLTALTQQFKRDLSLRDTEINRLKREKEELTQSLAVSKARCKKLLQLMGQGEEKEKVELLVENGKLKAVRDELTSEISKLSGDLEQERSKSQELAKELRRLQGNRASSSKQE